MTTDKVPETLHEDPCYPPNLRLRVLPATRGRAGKAAQPAPEGPAHRHRPAPLRLQQKATLGELKVASATTTTCKAMRVGAWIRVSCRQAVRRWLRPAAALKQTLP